MIFVGTDGGKAGAIVAINSDQKILLKILMPILKSTKGRNSYNVPLIVSIFKEMKQIYGEVFVVLEKAGSFSKGTIAIASTNYCQGMFEGILTALGIGYEIITPQTWQKEVLSGLNVADTKQASILFCHRKYPEEDFRPTARCEKDSDGICDALCLAVFCFRKNSSSKLSN